MQQLLAVIIALTILPFLLRSKMPSGWAIILIGFLAGFTAGFPVRVVFEAFTDVFFKWSSLSSVLTVVQIALLGALMTHYGLFRKAQDAIKQAIPMPKWIIMFMPSLIGILQVPGGAALSAPFCNSLGKEMGLSESQRSNTNVICRHLFSLMLPFSTWIIQVNDLVPEMKQNIFIASVICFSVTNILSNYFIFLRKAKNIPLESVEIAQRIRAFVKFLVNLFPVFSIILLSIILRIPVVFCVPIAVLITYLLGNRKEFVKQIGKGFNKNLAIMIVGVYFFQNIVKQMDQLLMLGSTLMAGDSESVFLIATALIAVLFGAATGLIYVSLSVLLPIVNKTFLPGSANLTIAVFYVFSWSYIGYMFSPVHMCQLLSDRECGCSVNERYRAYLPMIFVLATSCVIIYWILSCLFT